MKEGRKGEIAYALLQYYIEKSVKDGVSLAVLRRKIEDLAAETGFFDDDEIKSFLNQIIEDVNDLFFV